MIVEEIITIKGRELKKRYSDEDYYIKKVGTEELYAEAIDSLTATYQYEETDKKIHEEEQENGTNS